MTAFRTAAREDLNTGGTGRLGEIIHHPAGQVAGAIKALFDRGMSPEAKEQLGVMILTPFSQMSREYIDTMNREIMRRLPEAQRGPYRRLLNEVLQGAPAALPAVAIPAYNQQEVR